MRILKILGLLVVLFIVYQGYRICRDAGVWLEIEPVAYGQCHKVVGPKGSEDITIDKIHKVAFISAGNGQEVFDDYRAGGDGSNASDGDIWLLDMTTADSTAQQLNVDIEGGFHPHGIDLLHLKNGGRELYVINHPNLDSHEILIFTVSDDHQLKLRKRVRYPELISPNDIKAISIDQFLVTNDHGSPRSSVMHNAEDYLGLSRASVSYFDGNKGELVITGIRSANGIAMSQDQHTLYVAEATARRISRFTRDNTAAKWEFQDRIFVDSAVDNLEWDEQGRLLTGAHPKLFDFVAHIKDPSNLSPSHVLRINVDATPMSFETIYMNAGKELSGSSVGAMLNDELLIGAVLGTHFLRCRT
ncbi:SMP-30/gluconolactonase/LRE family protein [Paraglaciecola arctica]|uniref:SMP-30/gluconolactonase/LRE family protein n=1 Tax=Paraglaciecola arctica TaxID=1128911 RepID=UPI001C06EF31|nr:SMP-30/gluconolactonase/LRE family protein [Paraglaciecola arctica]MBU3004639.1 SMP-30/gluconolactonase/LRE family protein [Paraglaciecola arctica]